MREYLRPWKLTTLAIGLGLLLIGANYYHAPDWDYKISFIMAILAYFTYSLATGKDRMTEVCNQIKPGMTIVQLIKLAQEHGLGPRNLASGTKLAYLAETRSFGRHACKVELDAGIVNSATYSYAD